MALLFTVTTVCATVAEVRKRGEDFWAEFEFYLSVSAATTKNKLGVLVVFGERTSV